MQLATSFFMFSSAVATIFWPPAVGFILVFATFYIGDIIQASQARSMSA